MQAVAFVSQAAGAKASATTDSVEGKVRHLGIYVCPVLIVRYYSQISFSFFQSLCCVYTKGRIPAFVFADFFVVEINLCDRIYSFKFQIDFIICR